MKKLIPLVVLAAAIATPAFAQSIPNLDVTASCAGAASMAPGFGMGKQNCLDAEQNTRAQLAGEWTKFTPADRASCIATAKLGGEPTYTELITCLEMAQQIAQFHQAAAGSPQQTASPQQLQPAHPEMQGAGN